MNVVFLFYLVAGSSFGPNCAAVEAWLGKWPLILLACSHTLIQAMVPPGAGALYQVSVTAGSQSYTYTAERYSYAKPVIDSVSLGDQSTLPTTGFMADGQRAFITLYGSNFGPSTSALTVVYAGEPLP